MKKINEIFNISMKKVLTNICVILLLGSIMGISGIYWKDLDSNITKRFDLDYPNLSDNNSRTSPSSMRGVRLEPFIDLDNTTGYPHQNLTMYGTNNTDYAGHSVATGDVNGDNIDDIIIGAYGADYPSTRVYCGAVHVIFGNSSFPAQGFRDLATQADVTIYGAEQGDNAGYSVATGDVNGDNTDDIIIGAPGASGLGRNDCGAVYVICGSGTLSAVIDLNTTNASMPHQNVTIYGQKAWDCAGWDVASGDVSGDIKDDIITGTIYASGPGGTRPTCGEAYVINGKSFTSGTTIDLSTTPPDTIIYGADMGDQAGKAIATGNIDGSGKEDLIIGAPGGYGPGNARIGCGEVYLIYGSATLASSIDLNTWTAGTHADVIIYGIESSGFMSGDQAGSAVAAGDVDVDTNHDIIIGAPGAYGPGNARDSCGEVYIIYGSNSLSGTIDLNTSAGGTGPDVLIYGAEDFDSTGSAVEAGDINNDTKQDIFIGAPYATSGPNKNRQSAGEVYIINGSISLPPTIDFNTTTATPNHNVTIWGAGASDNAGSSIAAGDINGDTIGDLIIGAPNADGINENKPESGEIYAIYGIPKPNLNPWVTLTEPANSAVGVALNAQIIVNFSEPMNQFSFTTSSFSCTPDPGGWSINWNLNGDGMNLTHSAPFTEKTLYQFRIITANDLTGKSLVPHPGLLIPNPFNFTTGDFTEPMVTLTSPVNDTSNVNPKDNITITFSEPMNHTTVQNTCQPNPGGWLTPLWDATNSTVTFNHTNLFQEKRGYWFNITAGEDEYGLPLVENSSIPWHIYFTTGDFTPPKIVSTEPRNNDQYVLTNADILVKFSEPMDDTTIEFECDPDQGGWQTLQWNTTKDQVTFKHTIDFKKDTYYNFTITICKDIAGNDLISDLKPNPWQFKTIGDNPIITSTEPANGTENVLLNKDIIVTFSKPMKIETVTYTCTPVPNGGFTVHWNDNNDIATYKHATDFDKNTIYKFEITVGKDIDNYDLILDIKNPLFFKTIGDNPIILETVPTNNAINVYLESDINVKFSKPMNISSVKYSCNPDPGGWATPAWNAFKDKVTFKHSDPFKKNTEYTFEITPGKDLEGFDLIAGNKPNPWSFTTAGDNPMIIETNPEDGATQVLLDADVIVKFSKPMNITAIQYNCEPPISGGFTPVWNLDKTEVKYKHTTEFTKDTLYEFKITGAKDQEGYDLIQGSIPNPWTFTTIGDNPIIICTYPADDSTGIPLDADIIVEFNKPMDTNNVIYTCDPEPVGGFNVAWNDVGDEAAFKHTTDFVKNTVYTFSITAGKDLEGYNLVQGNIPNPWSFRTVGDEPVIFSTVPVDGDVNIELNKDIIVIFSEPMDTGTVTFNCTPDPNPGDWTIELDDDNKIVIFIHPTPFENNTKYKFEITGGEDLVGYELIFGPVPNPWEFTTGTSLVSELTTTLKSPKNGDTVDTLTPTLSWEGSDDTIIYYLYLGTDKTEVESHDGSLLITTQEISYTPSEKLAYDTIYYWAVIPSDGTDNGTCEVWSFTTPPEVKVSKDAGAEDWWLWIIIIIIVVIILIILAAVMLKRKKKAQPPDEKEGEAPSPTAILPPQHPPRPPIAEEPEIATVEPKEEHEEGVGGHPKGGTAETGVQSTPTPPQPSIVPPLTPAVSQPSTTQQSITQQPSTPTKITSQSEMQPEESKEATSPPAPSPKVTASVAQDLEKNAS